MEAILNDLYDSEINVQIECAWDSGWYAAFGNSYEGFKESINLDRLRDVLEWLVVTACKLYPGSTFAKKWQYATCQTEDCPYFPYFDGELCESCADKRCT